jgi:hypothetical protein
MCGTADEGTLECSERSILLRALFELSITQSAFDDDPDRTLIPIIPEIPREKIEALVRKLGGDRDIEDHHYDARPK